MVDIIGVVKLNGISEKEIIQKIRNGEINYFEFIVKGYSPKIQHYILRRINNGMDADDLTQNIFLKFYRAVTDYKFDEERAISPYLFQIAANELKMHYRGRRVTVSLDEIPEIEDNVKESESFGDELKEVLKVLKDNEKKAIMMLTEGYKYEEIAKKFKVPLNTIKTWIRRARGKIKLYG